MAKNSRQKKPNFLESLGTKVISIMMLHKMDKNKKVAPKLIFFKDFFFVKIWMIFDVEN